MWQEFLSELLQYHEVSECVEQTTNSTEDREQAESLVSRYNLERASLSVCPALPCEYERNS